MRKTRLKENQRVSFVLCQQNGAPNTKHTQWFRIENIHRKQKFVNFEWTNGLSFILMP